MLRALSRSIFSLVYPQECDICHGEVESRDDGFACSGCWLRSRIFDGSETLCTKCGAFLSSAARGVAETTCHKCEGHLYDRAYAVGLYEYALSVSVLRLKKVPHLPRRLRHLLLETLDGVAMPDTPLVIPVPLSRRRRQERGFNQAEIVAQIVAGAIRTKPDGHTLIRVVDTPVHRAGMDRKARAVSVKSAFSVARPKLVDGRNVLLVDDVLTSGSTASVCAAILKKNGAATVSVLTIARAA